MLGQSDDWRHLNAWAILLVFCQPTKLADRYLKVYEMFLSFSFLQLACIVCFCCFCCLLMLLLLFAYVACIICLCSFLAT